MGQQGGLRWVSVPYMSVCCCHISTTLQQVVCHLGMATDASSHQCPVLQVSHDKALLTVLLCYQFYYVTAHHSAVSVKQGVSPSLRHSS